jgi:hypothetical protein
MAEPKTLPTGASVADFLEGVEPASRREDGKALCALFEEVTGYKPILWGASIIGFGQYQYTYASGRTGDWPLTAFSPRKANLTVYVMPGFAPYTALLEKLGPYKTGSSCLYLKSLASVDQSVLREIIAASVADMQEKYPQA